MDDSLLVRDLEGFGDLLGDGERFIDRNAPPRNSLVEALPVDEFQHQELTGVCFVQTVDRANVWMVERGQRLGFPFKTGQTIRIVAQRLRQHLDGHVAAQFQIAGPIHLPHAPAADQREDFVSAEASAGIDRHGGSSGARIIRSRRPGATGFPCCPGYHGGTAERVESSHGRQARHAHTTAFAAGAATSTSACRRSC